MKPGVDLSTGVECRCSDDVASSPFWHEGAHERTGSAVSSRTLVEQLGPTTRAVAAALVGNQSAGNNIAVNAFAALHRAQFGGDLDTFQPHLLRNVVDKARRYDRTRRAGVYMSRLLVRTTKPDHPGASREAIWVALLSLHFRLRAAIVLREVAQLSFEAIGLVMDCDPQAAKTAVTKARFALASELVRQRGGIAGPSAIKETFTDHRH